MFVFFASCLYFCCCAFCGIKEDQQSENNEDQQSQQRSSNRQELSIRIEAQSSSDEIEHGRPPSIAPSANYQSNITDLYDGGLPSFFQPSHVAVPPNGDSDKEEQRLPPSYAEAIQEEEYPPDYNATCGSDDCGCGNRFPHIP